MLTVVCEVENINSRQKYPPRKYRCVCDCGKYKDIIGKDLIGGKTKSCGCLRGVKQRATKEQIMSALAERNLMIIGELSYQNTDSKISVVDQDGYKYALSLGSIKDKRIVRFDIVGKRNPYSMENIQNWLHIKNSNTVVLSKEYIDNKAKILCRCECGEEFAVSWNIMSNYDSYRCPKCTHRQSKNEIAVANYLDKCGVEYFREYWFSDCRNILPYKFDFYLPQHNTIIEVHGEQHYKQNNLFKLNIEEQKRRDIEKYNYCISRNFDYVVISYQQIQNHSYTEIINKILK